MNDFDARVSRARADLDELFDAAQVPAVGGVRRRHRRRRAAQLAAGGLVVATLAVGIVAAMGDDDRDDVRIADPTSTTSTSSTTGTTVAPGIEGVSASIELARTTLAPGETVGVEVVVRNETGAAAVLDDGPCRSDVGIRLANEHGVQPVVTTDDCPAELWSVAPGETRIPLTFTARFTGCAGPGREPTGEWWDPPCTANDDVPVLPAGVYRAELYGLPLLTRPEAIEITVAGAAPGPTATVPSTSVTPPPFPSARSAALQHGGPAWAVVLAGAAIEPGVDARTELRLRSAIEAASAAGFVTGPTDCDEGAAEALGLTPVSGRVVMTVSVYFDSEADARQALAAFDARGFSGGAVAEVRTYCLD